MSIGTQAAQQLDAQVRAELIDELMDRYVDWREQCIAVSNAYERWSNGPVADRRLAFEAFKAALDLEEHASLVYADRLSQVDRDGTGAARQT